MEGDNKHSAQMGTVVTSLVPALHFSKRSGHAEWSSDAAANEATTAALERSEMLLRSPHGYPSQSSPGSLPRQILQVSANAESLRHTDGMQKMLESSIRHGEEAAAALTRYALILREEQQAVQRLTMERDSKAAEVEVLRTSLQKSTHLQGGRREDAGILHAQLEAAEAHAAAEHARAMSADEIHKINMSTVQSQLGVMKAQVR